MQTCVMFFQASNCAAKLPCPVHSKHTEFESCACETRSIRQACSMNACTCVSPVAQATGAHKQSRGLRFAIIS